MANAQKDVSERLRYLISLKNMTIQEFGDFVGTPKGTLEKYLNSPRLPNAEFLSAIHSKMGVSAHWLLDGVEPMYLVDASELASKGVVPLREGPHWGPVGLAEGGVEFASPEQLADFVSVPRYDVEVSAGRGREVRGECVSGHYAFSRRWLERRGLQPDNLAVVRVSGDSMEPRLSDGDLAVIDTSDKSMRDGVTYVVRLGSELLVKRLQVLPQDHIKLCSHNTEFDPILIDLTGGELASVGRVVASMHEW